MSLDGIPRAGAPGWSNWLGNQRCAPRQILAPRDLEELVAVVGHARRRGLRVRMVGSGHSWSALCPTPDLLVQTHRMDRLLDVRDTRVTVEAGMPMGTLLRHAEAHGLSVVGSPMIREITVGGVVATGSHGTGLAHGPLSDAVESMTLVTGDGEVRTLDAGDPRLNGGRLSLGALGALHAVTLRLEPAFRVRVQEAWVGLDAALEQLPALARQTDFLSVYWLPCTDEAWLYQGWKTDRPADWGLRARARERLTERTLRGLIAPGALAASARVPRLTAPFLRLAARANRRPHSEVRTSALALHPLRVFPKLWDSSYAVPLEHSAEAVRVYVRRIREAARAGCFPINIAVHARFVKGSPAWLSPTSGRDSCFIEAVAAPSTRGVDAFYRGVGAELMERFDGRPHWAKVLHHLPRVRASLGARLSAFATLQRELDPAGTFVNDLVGELLEREPFGVAQRPLRMAAVSTTSPMS